jgi:hypothetical protein
MTGAQKGDLVQIHRIILEPDERPDSLPACTRAVPYESWLKGFLVDEHAKVGDQVTIQTFIGREIRGTLQKINPVYDHNFGVPQATLLPIGNEAKSRLKKKSGE